MSEEKDGSGGECGPENGYCGWCGNCKEHYDHERRTSEEDE